MSLKNRSTLKGISGVNTINVELHPHLSTAIGKSHPVGERLHNKNTLTFGNIIE